VALVLRRVLAMLVPTDEHAKDLEIVVLRHQLQVLRRQVGRPRFRQSDRLFLAIASRWLARGPWRGFLVTPQTVLRWHRELVRRKWSRLAAKTATKEPATKSEVQAARERVSAELEFIGHVEAIYLAITGGGHAEGHAE
jgi:hypothetical protein